MLYSSFGWLKAGWFHILACIISALVTSNLPVEGQSSEVILTEQDNGKAIEISLNQQATLQLRGNPSTGYTWIWSSTNGNSVTVIGDPTYVADSSGGVGGGGTFSFHLKAVETGETSFSLRYAKPWDSSSLASTFSVTLRVVNPSNVPQLSIGVRENKVVVSWPLSTETGFYLEGSQNLAGGWAALNTITSVEGSNYTVTLPTSGKNLFFKLRQ